MKNFANYLTSQTGDLPEFQIALDIVSKNAIGKVWLIGGMVYRNIVRELYGLPKPDIDLDFIVEDYGKIKLPIGWSSKLNHYGNPKLSNGVISIDFIPLNNILSIRHRNLKPTIGNFLSSTPLDIQSIAYDVSASKVIGSAGMRAILNKRVAVYNREQAELRSKLYGITVNDYIKEKANSLKFTPVLID